MTKTYQIQLPIEKNVKEIAENKANKIGLNTLNDLIKFLVVNFCEDRITISIGNKKSEMAFVNSNIFDPFTVSKHYNGLSVGTSQSNDFLYEAINFDSVSQLVPYSNDFHSFLLSYLGYNSPSNIHLVLMQDVKLLSSISEEVSGEPIKCGIDPQKNIVYVGIFDTPENNLKRIRKEITRLVSRWNTKTAINTLYVTEHISHFMREYGDYLQRKQLITLSREHKSLLNKVDFKEIGNYCNDTEERTKRIETATAVFASIYNKVGAEKFAKYFKYLNKNPNMGFEESVNNCLKEDIHQIIGN